MIGPPALAEPIALWVVPVAELGGVARHVLDVTRQGIEGFRLVVLCPPGPIAKRLQAQGSAVIADSFGPGQGVAASVGTLRHAVRTLRPAIVHSHLAYADLVLAATPLPAGIRRVSTEHGIAAPDGVYHGGGMAAHTMAALHTARVRRFDRLIAVSHATRQVMIDKWRVGGEITVIPNGVDRPAVVAATAGDHGPRVLSLSRLSPEKRIDQLIKAFALLRSGRPDASLTIAGEGPQSAQLRAQVTSAGMADAVRFVGFVDPAVAMGEADVVAQLSVWENCSYTLLDAAAYGLGIVASDVGGNPEIVRPESLVDADDLVAVAAALAGATDLRPDPPRLTVADMCRRIGAVYGGLDVC